MMKTLNVSNPMNSNNITVGTEIRTSLDFEWLKEVGLIRGWVANGPDFEWDLKSGSPNT